MIKAIHNTRRSILGPCPYNAMEDHLKTDQTYIAIEDHLKIAY